MLNMIGMGASHLGDGSSASVWVVGGAPETEKGAAHHTDIIQLFLNLYRDELFQDGCRHLVTVWATAIYFNGRRCKEKTYQVERGSFDSFSF